jgi:DNA invertase Pin-like site-specific DNA recombinase
VHRPARSTPSLNIEKEVQDDRELYARKSTSQEKATEEARSTSRQVALARAFAERQGWTVGEGHVYVDEAVSGGEIKKRVGLQALLAAAKAPSRPFDVLVMMAQSRLARRMRYAVDILHDLADCGVRVFSSTRPARSGSSTRRPSDSWAPWTASATRAIGRTSV